MAIVPKTEAALRKMLGHAMRGEPDDLARIVTAIGEQAYEEAIALAAQASGYIAVDVSGRWPTDADIREIAKHAAKSPAGLPASEAEIRDYLARVVLGSESPLAVFPDARQAALVPLSATASLLLSFGRPDTDQWGYLDQIWNAIETAGQIKPDVLPAIVYAFQTKNSQ